LKDKVLKVEGPIISRSISMTSPTKDPFPIDWEERLIDGSFDSTVLFVFLMGMCVFTIIDAYDNVFFILGVYTVIILGTLDIYRKVNYEFYNQQKELINGTSHKEK